MLNEQFIELFVSEAFLCKGEGADSVRTVGLRPRFGSSTALSEPQASQAVPLPSHRLPDTSASISTCGLVSSTLSPRRLLTARWSLCFRNRRGARRRFEFPPLVKSRSWAPLCTKCLRRIRCLSFNYRGFSGKRETSRPSAAPVALRRARSLFLSSA